MTLPDVVIERKVRTMYDWARHQHMPAPVVIGDAYRCEVCRRRLRPYTDRYGERRLRHYWRER